MIGNHWQLQDAKNRFSNLVEKAQSVGPQVVTKHGRETVVVLSVEEYRKLIRPKSGLVEFFRNSPHGEEEIDLFRSRDLPRDTVL